MSGIIGTLGGGILNSAGYTPAVAANAEALILINEYAFIPALEKIDIATTKALWG